MASKLNISQSQYCRKEANTIGFTDEEWESISALFKMNVDELKETNSKILQKYSSVNSFENYAAVSEKLFLELKEHNNTLKEIITLQKKEIYELRTKLKSISL